MSSVCRWKQKAVVWLQWSCVVGFTSFSLLRQMRRRSGLRCRAVAWPARNFGKSQKRAKVFCLGHRLLKHKTTRWAKNLGRVMASSSPWLRLWYRASASGKAAGGLGKQFYVSSESVPTTVVFHGSKRTRSCQWGLSSILSWRSAWQHAWRIPRLFQCCTQVTVGLAISLHTIMLPNRIKWFNASRIVAAKLLWWISYTKQETKH